ncbi:hypothetical protein [Bradyrhizobium liaoningense]
MTEQKPISASANMVGLSAATNEFITKLMDSRGAIMLAFAQVEWFLAKLIVEASKYEQYQALDLSFSQDADKRAERLKKILNVDGPFSPYAKRLIKAIDEVMAHITLRTMSAHGLTVRPDSLGLSEKIHFRMYRMFKGGVLNEEKLDLTIKEYTDQAGALSTAARAFVQIVREIWGDLKLSGLDPDGSEPKASTTPK